MDDIGVSHGIRCHFIYFCDWLKPKFGGRALGVALPNQLRRFRPMLPVNMINLAAAFEASSKVHGPTAS